MQTTLFGTFLLLIAVAACGNADNALNTRKGERALTGWLEKQEMPPEKVVCPENVKMVVETVFICQATIANADSLVLDIQITVVSKTGDVKFKHLTEKLVSAQVERGLRGSVKDQLGSDVVVDCGLRVRPLVPGNTFACTANSGKDNPSQHFEVTMVKEAPFWSAKLTSGPVQP